MAPPFDFANLAPYQQAVAAQLLDQSRVDPLQEMIKAAQAGRDFRDAPRIAQQKALQDQLALDIQRANLQRLQRPELHNVAGVGLVQVDPTKPEVYSVVAPAISRSIARPVTYRYETREDGTYAIPSNDPFNAVRVNLAGGGTSLPGRPGAPLKTPQTKWTYQTREDGTYAISSEDPTNAVRVTMKDGTVDQSGVDELNLTESEEIIDTTPTPAPSPAPMPGRPKAPKPEKPLPKGISERISDAKSAIDNLVVIKSYIDNPDVKAISGPVAGRTLGVNPFSTTVGNFDGVRNMGKQVIGKYLEGGVLRMEDERKYETIIPSKKMLPAVQQNQAQVLYNSLKKKLQNDLSAYEKSGYNVDDLKSKFDELDAAFSGQSNSSSVTILMPDGRAGDIPSDQVESFLKKHPGSKVSK